MVGVVLAEYEILKVAVLVDDGKGIELVIPDDVVSLLKSGGCGSGNELIKGMKSQLDWSFSVTVMVWVLPPVALKIR